MSIKEKFKRTGAFVIDFQIVKMFAQVLIGGVYYAIMGISSRHPDYQGLISSTGNAALPLMLAICVFILLLFIGMYLGYHWVCYRYLGNSLARFFLKVSVVSRVDGSPVDKKTYFEREFYKIALCLCTLGLYALYSGSQYYAFGRKPYHDNRYSTEVEVD
ncbi:RDD family protein [Vibrio porteresiae]|uniref:RDD family protein n=1 Tax=Vibrio porteresiae DSM 19223 TaxID=1123496 RepID=A0ABZ0QHR6_9VIBR|nr:RDD family protein [Vibrio porteresiae]WPC74986.1 RDD family protein [Vibrio porteresiae DSM 19223]